MAPVLYVIACGGPPAGQVAGFVQSAQGQGWDVCVIATPDGARFLDTEHLVTLTGHPVRVNYKQPYEGDVLPPADAMVVAPATFSTVNKLASGISDTLALGLLNEAVGMGLPIIVVPWPNVHLSRHPAFQRSIADLRDWGITLIYDPANLPDATPEPAVFPWETLRAHLTSLNERS
ncbi:MAG: flavoprotein [Streptosporangiaceae bacterium]|nr:flavoprotein [Streptosporangiaceae bacterium]